jgi:hypothetical protein
MPRRNSPRRTATLRLHALEGREVPAVVNWTLGASGDFANAAAWTDAGNGSHHVPGPTDDAVIPSAFSVSSSANQAVNSLSARDFSVLGGTFASTQPIARSSGTLTVAAGAALQAAVQANGGTLTGSGTVTGPVTSTATLAPGGVVGGTLRVTGNVSQTGTFTARLNAPSIPSIHLINGAGQSLTGAFAAGQPFVTDFRGTDDVTVTPVGGQLAARFNSFYTPAGNNPAFLTGFIGPAANGTGNGTAGTLATSELSAIGNAGVQYDFAQPLTSADRFLVEDVDLTEQYLIRAFVRSGANYVQVPLTGWVHQALTGGTGVQPDSRWPTWDPAAGTLTGTNSGNLSEPVDAFTPDQPIDRVVFTRMPGGGPGTPTLQVVEPSIVLQQFSQLAVTGTVTVGGALSVSPGTAIPLGTQFRIIDNDGTDPVAGTFNGLPEGATVTASGQDFVITYHGGTGNDVVLTRGTAPAAAPRVSGVAVNAGQANTAQRSRVTNLTVTFDSQVTFANNDVTAAFGLSRIGGGAVGGFTATASVANGVTVVTLSGFTGAETQFGSLADGRYSVLVRASLVSAGGQQLDGDGNGTGGDDYALAGSVANGLFRLFGDVNADGVVNAFDFGQFRPAFGSSAGQAGYLDYLDVNGDGSINAFDFGQLRTRFGSSVP